MKRYLLSIDKTGVYMREVLCVTHDADSGEVIYDAKPVDKMPAWVMKKLQSAQPALAGGREATSVVNAKVKKASRR